jgi:Cdc6-like AAA superfamily ATPase
MREPVLTRLFEAAMRRLGSVVGRDDHEPLSAWREQPVTYVSVPPSQAQRSTLPRFQRTAGDLPNPGYGGRSAALRARLLNAYTPARPVVDRRMFAGRTKILQSLIHAIEEERLHLVLYGERGVGKTSLLQQISQAAKDARYLVTYIDCGQRTEFDETFRAVAAGIPLMYHSAYGPTSVESERGDTLADLLGPEPMTVAAALEALSHIEGARVLLILDDFDHIGSEEFRHEIAELLKRLSDRAVYVQALIAGVPAELAALVGQVPSLHRNVVAMRIPRMMDDEIRDIIGKAETVSGVHFDDEALDAIIAACAGSPYLAKLLGYRAALAAVDHDRETIEAEDVGASIQDAIDDLSKTVSRHGQLRIEELTRRGQLPALAALARASQATGGWYTMEEVSTALRSDPLPPRNTAAVIKELVEHDILLEIEGEGHEHAFRFVGPTLPDYISLLVARSRWFGAKPDPATAALENRV